MSRADISVKHWRNMPISNPKPDFLHINACTVWLKSLDIYASYRPENENNSVKPDLHNINAHTKFGKNPLIFTQIIIRKRKRTDGRTDGRTDRHTHVQRKTMIPRHYSVAGYKDGSVQTA